MSCYHAHSSARWCWYIDAAWGNCSSCHVRRQITKIPRCCSSSPLWTVHWLTQQQLRLSQRRENAPYSVLVLANVPLPVPQMRRVFSKVTGFITVLLCFYSYTVFFSCFFTIIHAFHSDIVAFHSNTCVFYSHILVFLFLHSCFFFFLLLLFSFFYSFSNLTFLFQVHIFFFVLIDVHILVCIGIFVCLL